MTMTTEEAAWVRAHVWLPAMRRTYASTPLAFTRCPCQNGLSGHCEAGGHRHCWHHLGRQTPEPETWICNTSWMALGFHSFRFEHATPTITGARRLTEAMVWLADRACIWRCPCDCHQPGGASVHHQPPRYEQLSLFEETTPW